MNRISILPEDLINKIAAGEVIERPASVVKELVENAIDAGSTRVTIEVQDAGINMIRVSDNGPGMSKDEIKIAVERHSTSKISSLNDLFNIVTLGFRGEALPSIASVSRFEILSKNHDEKAGSSLKMDGGKIIADEEAAAPSGTMVLAKDLFFNTPARKKFLKSPATEMGHIGEVASKYAVAYPGIAFKLISDGKVLLSSPGSGKLIDAVASVYGIDIAKDLIAVDYEFGSGKVTGYISRPTTSRIDKTYENFFVNRRHIHNFLLNRALENAYRTLIPLNRYPVGIIFIDIDPQKVDVNVHPAKREVKFMDNQEVMHAVQKAAEAALKDIVDKQPERFEQSSPGWRPEMADVLFKDQEQSFPPTRIETELIVSNIQPLMPIYQFKDTYLICTDGVDLVVIDQHAAHERILYDRLSGRSSPDHKQPLLIPETIELNAKDAAILNENLEYLASLGFDLEEFGNNSYILRAVPHVAVKSGIKQMIIDIISEARELGRSVQVEAKKESIRKLIACHSAIKAGDKLTVQEINQLIKDLYATENPTTCPHGRPTMIKLTEEEFIKRFAR
ncbi:MAG: DNA mismatch repair endonuclease MutL [Candidatus Margulisiibacteriota bacterium]